MEVTPQDVSIPVENATLNGNLSVPAGAQGIVVFAHGSGSSRLSPRNQQVASALQEAGLGTLLFDLLTEAEAVVDARTREHRFDIPLLGERLVVVTDWLHQQDATREQRIGYFGASTGAAQPWLPPRSDSKSSRRLSRAGDVPISPVRHWRTSPHRRCLSLAVWTHR